MNEGSEGEIRERTVDDLIQSFDNCNGDYAFLIGAGMSKRAGIDTAYDLIEKWRDERYERVDPNTGKSEWVKEKEKDVPVGGEYGFWFQQRYPTYEERRRFIRDLVDNSRPKREHIILAALMKGKDAPVPHILTPNFDDLLYDAFYRYFDERPLLIDHNAVVPQFQLTSDRAAIIKLHGDYLYDNLQNLDTDTLEENMEEAVKRTLREYGLIVVGYSGRDDSIMNVVNDDSFEISGHGVYWCTLDKYDLSPKAEKLLEKPNTYVVEIDGAESLFTSFFESMKDMIDPRLPDPSEIRSRAENRAAELPGEVGESDESEFSELSEIVSEADEDAEEEVLTLRSEINEEEIENIPTESDQLDSASLRMRADNLRYDEKHEQAVKLYSVAIELDQNDPIAYMNRGLSRLKLSDPSAKEDFETALKLHKRENNKRSEATALSNLGVVAKKRSNLDEAEQYHKDSLEIKREIGDRSGEAKSLGNLGVIAKERGNLGKAEKYYKDSLDIHRKIGDRSGEAKSLGNLGLVAKERGHLDRAEKYHKDSLEIKREIGDRSGEATALNNLGLIARERDNLDEAEKYHEESLEIKREIGDRSGEANSLNNLGLVARERDNLDEAEQYHEDSLEIKREIGDRSGEATALNNLGVVARERGNLDEAEQYHQEALEIVVETGSRIREAKIRTNLGEVEKKRDQLEDSEEYLQKAFEEAEKIESRLIAIDAVENLVDIYEEKEEIDEAIKWCDRGLEIAEETDVEKKVDFFTSRCEELEDDR
jgi:tetratricopeptide (TPR) repeat protein